MLSATRTLFGVGSMMAPWLQIYPWGRSVIAFKSKFLLIFSLWLDFRFFLKFKFQAHFFRRRSLNKVCSCFTTRDVRYGLSMPASSMEGRCTGISHVWSSSFWQALTNQIVFWLVVINSGESPQKKLFLRLPEGGIFTALGDGNNVPTRSIFQISPHIL